MLRSGFPCCCCLYKGMSLVPVLLHHPSCYPFPLPLFPPHVILPCLSHIPLYTVSNFDMFLKVVFAISPLFLISSSHFLSSIIRCPRSTHNLVKNLFQVPPQAQVVLGDPSTSLGTVSPSTLSLLIPSCGRAEMQTLPSVETIGRKLLPAADGLSPRSLRYIAGQKLTTSMDVSPDPVEQRTCVGQQHMIPITVDSWHHQFLGQSSGQPKQQQGYGGGSQAWQPISDTEPRLFPEQTRYTNVLSDIVDPQQSQSEIPELRVDDVGSQLQSRIPQVTASQNEPVHEALMSGVNTTLLIPSDVPKFSQLQDLLLQKDSALRFIDVNHDANKWIVKNKPSEKIVTDSSSSNSNSTLPTSNSIVMNVLHSQALVQHILETSQDTANDTASVTAPLTVDSSSVMDGDTGQYQQLSRCTNL